eukprot:9300230-Prorocentrum_lima.AAC.1
MTSSLVGSEMCIRDSTQSKQQCGQHLSGVAGCEARCEEDGGFQAGSQGPVSYTHLTLPTICSV